MRVTERQERFAESQEQITESLERVGKRQEEMAARPQYHDEAFERHSAEMKAIREAIEIDSENIRALVARIAERHNHRLEDIEGGEAA